MQSFFYDGQIRRFLIQFARMMSNFQVEYGRDVNGDVTYMTVPVRYGDATRQAQAILQNNSANGLPSAPMMTFYISALDYDRNRMQEPYHISKMHVRQRAYDPETEAWDVTQGNAFTVERQMPVPYLLGINLDVWTTNTNQKFQIFEQITTLFNPSLEIQSTDNFIDWTSLSVVELQRTTWSSRSIPSGTDDPIDILSMSFNIPVWIASPARVKKLGVINKIIAGIYDAKGDMVSAIANDDLLLGTRLQITPQGYHIVLVGNQLHALRTNASIDRGSHPTSPTYGTAQTTGSQVDWRDVIDQYGTLRDGISMMRLFNDDAGVEVYGFVAYHPTDPKVLLFTIDNDTIPSDTTQPVDAVIDPQRSGPGAGLVAASVGQRYLIIEDLGHDSNAAGANAWGNVVASTNDIIEFDGSEWGVSFDASETTDTHFVTNITTEIQYRWTGNEWLKSYEGLYEGGEWTIVI